MERRKSFVSFIVRAGVGAWAGAVFRNWGMSGVREVPFGLDNGLSHWVADGMIVSLIDFILILE